MTREPDAVVPRLQGTADICNRESFLEFKNSVKEVGVCYDAKNILSVSLTY